MDTPKFTLSKSERLCSKNSIDLLFSKGSSFVVFPFRIVYTLLDDAQQDSRAAMFVSVPKKKFKRAVKRNLIRRRVKEAYRLNKHLVLPVLEENNLRIAIAFLYLDKEIRLYDNIESKMKDLLIQLGQKLKEDHPVKP
ncbi:MAG: ribonuclease P protein component [Bacteroidales bacterium]